MRRAPAPAAAWRRWPWPPATDRDPMQQQERDDAFSERPFFADGRAMRPPVPGTVSQEWYRQQAPRSWSATSPDAAGSEACRCR